MEQEGYSYQAYLQNIRRRSNIVEKKPLNNIIQDQFNQTGERQPLNKVIEQT